MHLFKGIQDTLANLEWQFRDIGWISGIHAADIMLYDFRGTFQSNFRDLTSRAQVFSKYELKMIHIEYILLTLWNHFIDKVKMFSEISVNFSN